MQKMISLRQDHSKQLSVYFTAGYPRLEHTARIITALSEAGVDLIEIGIPFSDPMADGQVIQKSSQCALDNGMHVELLFTQLEPIRQKTSVPLVLMSYANPIVRFGLDPFCARAAACGINGLIVPDLPPEVYQLEWQPTLERFGLNFHLLISPNTPDARVRELDRLSSGFLYVVTAPGTTGGRLTWDDSVQNYFRRLKNMRLKNRLIAGFGIEGPASFRAVCSELDGGIIGSAFIRMLETASDNLEPAIDAFIRPYKMFDQAFPGNRPAHT